MHIVLAPRLPAPGLASDHELMAAVASKNENAFQELMRRHMPKSLSFAERLLGNKADAEDAAQDAFLKLWEIAPRYRADAAFTTFWHRILYSKALDRLRKRKPQASEQFLLELVDPGASAEKSVIEKQRAHAVKSALAKLPERQRAAFVLCYYQGMNQEQAAETLEITVGALESLLVRARKELREQLKNWL